MSEIIIPTGSGPKRFRMLVEFADALNRQTPRFTMSSRGWCYFAEGERLINKDMFDRFQNLINECRKTGLLPIDFTAQDAYREFKFSKTTDRNFEDPYEWADRGLNLTQRWHVAYDPDVWIGEDYYIQMLVEKVDLVELFKPICEVFRIPIATAKGWCDIYQRGEMAKRFQEMADHDCAPILLYCGDHDPAGLRISDFLKKNFEDLADAKMTEMAVPWDPEELVVDRFGLNYDFIEEHNLTWIDNLITGSKKNLASTSHPDHYKDYVQDYIQRFGVRKVEANALMKRDVELDAQMLCVDAVEKYLGKNAYHKFKNFTSNERAEVHRILEEIGAPKYITLLRERLGKLQEKEEGPQEEDEDGQEVN